MDTKDLISITERILATPSVEEVVTPKTSVIDDGLKAVKVPDSYVDQVLGFADTLNEGKTPKPVVHKIDEVAILRERRKILVNKLKGIIKEAKDLMQEMTSVGCLGVGPAKKMGMVRSDPYPPKPKKKSKNNGSR